MQKVLPQTATAEDLAHVAVQQHAIEGFQDRETIFRNVVRHLVHDHDCTLQAAKLHAAKAIGDLDAKKTNVRVELTKSTLNCVFVSIEGELKALTVLDLERALASADVRL